ncbi:NAD(P)-binding domain-containing protein [Escherichia coli]
MPVINCMSQPLDRLLMNYCHLVPSVLNLLRVNGSIGDYFIMVPDTPQVEEVLFGENGCTKASLKGKTIVDMSSIPRFKLSVSLVR